MHYSECGELIILDSKNEGDRVYAHDNLIGSLIKYNWRFMAAAKGSAKETCTSCNINTATTCDKCKELAGKKEPEFYCSINSEKVKTPYLGMSWEFSDCGIYWKSGVLTEVEQGSSYPFKSSCGFWRFMRPIQPKPVKHLSIEEAEKELGLTYSDSLRLFTGMVLSVAYVEERLSEKFNCEVVIDE